MGRATAFVVNINYGLDRGDLEALFLPRELSLVATLVARHIPDPTNWMNVGTPTMIATPR